MCPTMRRSSLICVASLAIWAGGCGGDTKPSRVDARVIADAANKTSAAGTAHVSTSVTGLYRGHRLGLGTRTGVVDGKRRRGVLDFDFSFLAPTHHGGPPPESAKGTIVYYGDVVFAQTGALYMRYASGKAWYELTRDKLLSPAGPGAGLSGLGTVDPTRPVDLLRAAHGDARLLGSRRLGGVAVKGYATVIDFTRYLDMALATHDPAFAHAARTFEQRLSARNIPVEAWIAADGTIRRMRTTLGDGPLRLTFTTDLAGIGDPASVRRPDPDTVFDLRGR